MPRYLPLIDPQRCTGCGRCLPACAPHVLVLERRGWEKVSALVDAAACTGCHQCAGRCPFGAITMQATAPREGLLGGEGGQGGSGGAGGAGSVGDADGACRGPGLGAS
jgi:Fe-S-cluster-containing hydrogenase component 2